MHSRNQHTLQYEQCEAIYALFQLDKHCDRDTMYAVCWQFYQLCRLNILASSSLIEDDPTELRG